MHHTTQTLNHAKDLNHPKDSNMCGNAQNYMKYHKNVLRSIKRLNNSFKLNKFPTLNPINPVLTHPGERWLRVGLRCWLCVTATVVGPALLPSSTRHVVSLLHFPSAIIMHQTHCIRYVGNVQLWSSRDPRNALRCWLWKLKRVIEVAEVNGGLCSKSRE